MVRPGNWLRPAGVSPVPVGAGALGSRPRFGVERWRAARGVEGLSGGSKRVGRSAEGREPCTLVRVTMGEPRSAAMWEAQEDMILDIALALAAHPGRRPGQVVLGE